MGDLSFLFNAKARAVVKCSEQKGAQLCDQRPERAAKAEILAVV